jgi:hypothetical protein
MPSPPLPKPAWMQRLGGYREPEIEPDLWRPTFTPPGSRTPLADRVAKGKKRKV